MEELFQSIVELLTENTWIGLIVVLFLIILFRKEIWKLLVLGVILYGIAWVAEKIGYEAWAKDLYKKLHTKKVR